MNTGRLLLMTVLLLGAAGCAALRPPTEASSDAALSVPGDLADGTGWWYARFFIERPAGEPPRWYIGTLIGGEIIAPVFERHNQDILIWRVHRRAANDDYGHVFSFIFYSTAAGAQSIYADLEKSPVLQRLRQEGRVTKVGFDNTSRISRPRIEDTSDRHWSLSVQQTWPALAMGASRMWLDLVGEVADKHADEQDLEQRYMEVQQEVNDIWAKQGQHAVLHHLSGIFAYQPLLITY
ncbi:MAG: hypothetical protein WCH04_14770 [Gammaproteobacteria bacterium]